ncbi:hypothetical protein F4775DRAFT_599689 [Biscogniauxia sp. FL1348]|nr:hypothetical protein F4775DRAFT_599689 [Biscogniauxia sp. FL1348]
MPLKQGKVAFVTGVNGISGNAIVEHLIRQPPEEWTEIIITSRSPLKTYWQDYRIRFIAIDFLQPLEETIKRMAFLCRRVTHAFFTSYVHHDDFAQLKEHNVPLFENFLTAIDTVAGTNLQRVCLQTGGKHYGVHLGPVMSPALEDLPRYDDKGTNFYYPQEDFMFSLERKRPWSYNIIRPNAIVGFTPGKNGMSQALTIALYMLICKELGETPKFPGNKLFYYTADDNSYAPSIADLSVWAVTQEHTANEAFNHANGDIFVWRYFFPKVGKYFGIDIPLQTEFAEEGTTETQANDIPMANWVDGKREVWHRICDKYGGTKEAFDWGTWGFLDWNIGKAWSTLSSITKARKFGWDRYDDTFETWVQTFRTFENAGVLPQRELIAGDPVDATVSMATSNGTNGYASSRK